VQLGKVESVEIKRFRVGVLFAAVAMVATGCMALKNAPSGGGATTVSSYTIGPLNLAPMGQPGSESETTQSNVSRPAGAFGITSMDFDLVDASGTPVARDMAHLHHALLMNAAHTDVLCPGREERFSGAGAERTPLRLPSPYAYLVGANDRWDSLWHIMNLSDMPMQVYIKYTIGYQTGANASNTRNVVPYFADVTGCGNSVFNVPGNGGPDSMYSKARTWNAPTDGIMVYAGGHLHGGGVDLTLHDGLSGAECVMTAHYDTPGMMGMMDPPLSIDTCPAHNLVVKGQPYTLTARYDNSMPYTDVMGISIAYVWPGRQ
jgi:hypothetical protein